MRYNIELLKIAVEQMASKYKIQASFFECKYRKRRGRILGIKVVIDARYLDYQEAWDALKKWGERITYFYSMEFTIETFHVHIKRHIRVSILLAGLNAQNISDNYCLGNTRKAPE